MRKLLVISFLFFVGLNGFGQKKKYYEKELNKGYGVMPGATMVDSNLFVDQTEVTNFMYLEYQYWIERVFGTGSAEFSKVLPDTTVWYNQKCLYGFVDYYLKHPWYRNYPAVGISQEQAKLYCKWRSDRVFEIILINNGILEHNPNQNHKNYFSIENYFNGKYNGIKPSSNFLVYPKYSLPTLIEWTSGKEYYDNNIKLKTCKSKWCDFHINKQDTLPIIYNIEPCLKDSMVRKPTKVVQCTKNKMMGWDFYGNVSEWLNDKNSIIGGNWVDSNTLNFDVPIKNEYPTEYVGFRCVARWKKHELK
ncbi:SUMF1/EgtB/PvdO family nonheme iron enzyme [Vicingaceae bacterium]|nr:SUMF1/EgtB/PvdO family nonheme iron enzyme [Vicingaceae bacterium]